MVIALRAYSAFFITVNPRSGINRGPVAACLA